MLKLRVLLRTMSSSLLLGRVFLSKWHPLAARFHCHNALTFMQLAGANCGAASSPSCPAAPCAACAPVSGGGPQSGGARRIRAAKACPRRTSGGDSLKVTVAPAKAHAAAGLWLSW
jgi:hypothetical protein